MNDTENTVNTVDTGNVPDATEEIGESNSAPDITDEITADTDEEKNSDNTEQALSIDELNETIKGLKAELEAYKIAAAREEAIANQINEFAELFPDVSIKSIPDDVWDNVKKGNSLAAAYSVYERRITEAARRIELINAKNAEKAAGIAGKSLPQEFFSADDVRKMSPSEVRANYAKIRRSMEKWN